MSCNCHGRPNYCMDGLTYVVPFAPENIPIGDGGDQTYNELKIKRLEERVAELERFQTIVMDEVLKNVMRLLDDRDTQNTEDFGYYPRGRS